MKPIKAWAVISPVDAKGGIDCTELHWYRRTAVWVAGSETEFDGIKRRIVRVEIRELPPKARKGTR